MRTEWKLFTGLGIFMLPLGIIYWLASMEIAGSILLVVVAIAFAFIGVYLAVESRKMDGVRPEDFNASQIEGAGEVGTFPGASIWPLIAAVAMLFIGLGLTFSTFVAIPGLGLLLAAVIGMARESDVAEVHFTPIDEHNHSVAPAPDFSDQVKK